jgi:hypothetical protein
MLKIAVEIFRAEPSLELGFQESREVGVQVKAGSHCGRHERMESYSFRAAAETLR